MIADRQGLLHDVADAVAAAMRTVDRLGTIGRSGRSVCAGCDRRRCCACCAEPGRGRRAVGGERLRSGLDRRDRGDRPDRWLDQCQPRDPVVRHVAVPRRRRWPGGGARRQPGHGCALLGRAWGRSMVRRTSTSAVGLHGAVGVDRHRLGGSSARCRLGAVPRNGRVRARPVCCRRWSGRRIRRLRHRPTRRVGLPRRMADLSRSRRRRGRRVRSARWCTWTTPPAAPQSPRQRRSWQRRCSPPADEVRKFDAHCVHRTYALPPSLSARGRPL